MEFPANFGPIWGIVDGADIYLLLFKFNGFNKWLSSQSDLSRVLLFEMLARMRDQDESLIFFQAPFKQVFPVGWMHVPSGEGETLAALTASLALRRRDILRGHNFASISDSFHPSKKPLSRFIWNTASPRISEKGR